MLSDVPRSAARSGKGASLGFIRPLRPVLVPSPPTGGGWLHEIKHDGYRTVVVVQDSTARAFSHNGHDWSNRYAPVVRCAGGLACRSAVLDGEMIVQGADGVSDFHALRWAMAREPHRLVYYAFDLLHLDSEDLRARPLDERKARLGELLGPADPFCPIQLCEHFEGDGSVLFEAAAKMGVEGIVSKRADSRYKSGRSPAWRKTKCWESGNFVVIGTEPGNAGPPVALLAREGDHGLVYAGSAFVTLAEPGRELFWRRVKNSQP